MSKYSQLPRDTLELLELRAQKGMDIKDYINWAVSALSDGFDSPSLAILAGLDYGVISQIEASEYFLRAVKELNLPIPDSELAWGDWSWTDSLYRKLGLTLPDEATLVCQHLEELAEQIRDGVIDPITGLDRIYNDILITYLYGPWEYGEIDLWKWDELRDSVYYDENYKKRNDPSQKNKEIIALATQWLESPKARSVPEIKSDEPIHILDGQSKQVARQSMSDIEIDEMHIKDQIEASIAYTLSHTGIARKRPDIVLENTYIKIKKSMFGEVMFAIFFIVLTALFLNGVFFFVFIENERVSIGTLLGILFSTLLFGALSVERVTDIRFDILKLIKRKEWIKNALYVQAKIVDRRAEYNDYAETREELWDCEIKIQYPTNFDERLIELVVRAKVSDNIYFKYEDQITIPIFLSKFDPNCFVIDGE